MQISIEGFDGIKSKDIESASIEVQGRHKSLPDNSVIRLDHNWAYLGIGQFVEIIPREMVKLNFKMKIPKEKAPMPTPTPTPKEPASDRYLGGGDGYVKAEGKKKEDVKAFI